MLKGERFSVEGGEIHCCRGRDSVLKGERFSVVGERFSVEGGEIHCCRGEIQC